MDLDYSKYSILIVDDVPLNVILVKRMLSKYPLTIRTANDGFAALKSIEEAKPDLVILDIMMPKMDGYEVLKRIRTNPETRDLKVVFLSALNTESEVLKGLDAGANDFITKPILTERLFSCVNNQLVRVVK